MNYTKLRLAQWAGLFFISTSNLSCATYQGKVSESRKLLETGNFTAAVEKLEPLATTEGSDQLIYLLDYGVALQLAGKTKESNSILIRSDKLAESLDYHSVSKVAGSMVLNEEMKQYKGDTFEKIFINAYLAMNFLSQNNLDDALVESRRMNEKYKLYRQEEKQKFELNVFGKYLSALIWEASKQYDDAYIAYKEAYDIDPSLNGLDADLIRSAKLARRSDEYNRWKTKFPKVVEDPSWYDRNMGELVVIHQQGWGPRKEMDPYDFRFPILKPVYSQTYSAQVMIDGIAKSKTNSIYDVEKASIQTLQDDRAALIARRLAGTATKAVLADQVRQKDELAGLVTWVVLRVSDRADLRQWSTLPQQIKLSKIYLKPGKYKVALQGIAFDGSLTGESMSEREIEVKANQKNFVVWRSLK